MLSHFQLVAHEDAPWAEGSSDLECVDVDSLPNEAEVMPVVDWPAVFKSIREYKQFQQDSKRKFIQKKRDEAERRQDELDRQLIEDEDPMFQVAKGKKKPKVWKGDRKHKSDKKLRQEEAT